MAAEESSPSIEVIGQAAALPESPGFTVLQRWHPDDEGNAASSSKGEQPGFIMRNLRRGLEDQKQLLSAPFKAKNIKWDAMVLLGTGGLLAVDRQISRQIPTEHVNISHDVALVALLGTSAAAGSIWLYGLKTGDRHANETGQLTLETLANTFLIYTPMQFIAGRERPDEAAGNGRFWRHGGFNTSFPAGHPMFQWAMASVIAHEYPKTWVKILAYGTSFTLTAARLTGRNHFASDLWVGGLLGYFIGAHIFHARCEPGISPGCHRE
jgi:membrane-associated phospholipid phosphatase